VGEHTLGLLLALLNKITRADRQVRAGHWKREENRGMEIMDKVVGIIGYGNMGSAFAQRLKGFNTEVISYDKYKNGYSDGNTVETSMQDLFERSDIVSLHVPLTEETHHLAGDRFFDSFNKPIWLINTSRGGVVDTTALVRAMRSGRVRGAALDVLELENSGFEREYPSLPDDLRYLLGSEDVVITPHVAGWTVESEIKLARVLAEKIIALSLRHKS
jgi:D-3-phosphoglycerate dehydrogenase